jgi:hypothetical protein
MSNRQVIIAELGTMLEQAARSSVARGAAYNPGEPIQLDSQAAWNLVAETLVAMVEVMAREGVSLDKTDDQS